MFSVKSLYTERKIGYNVKDMNYGKGKSHEY